MLRIENLFSGYGKGLVLEGINLNFNQGILYSVLGPNGSGKSTFLKSIAKIIKIDKGTISIDGFELSKLSQREVAKRIAYLPQITNSLPNTTVLETILLGRKPHISFEPTEKDVAIVERIIHEFDLSSFAFKNINELSGGEVQKILIARAFAQEPRVLLLDEPVNHLDPKNQIEILKIIKRFTAERNLITIIVLHDINLAINFADYFILMKEGRIIREGNSQIIEPTLIKEVYSVDAEIIKIGKKRIVLMEN